MKIPQQQLRNRRENRRRQPPHRHRRRRLSRLSFRLLAFNLLLLFLPVGSMLYLDTYERQLLDAQERAMVQEGRIFSSALAGRDLKEESLRIMDKLSGRVESRIRVLDADGRLLADSAVDSPGAMRTDTPQRSTIMSYRKIEPREEEEKSGRESILYRLLVPPTRKVLSLVLPPDSPISSAEYYSGKDILLGPEIESALQGRYGATIRISSGGQRSVNLYSALPITSKGTGGGGPVEGVVLVSRSTYRILSNLYMLRLDIITIFLYSFAAAVLLSLIASLTITRPLRKLRDRAEELLSSEEDLHSSLRDGFPSLRRHDEIGDLSRSLQELWGRLEKRIELIDRFTSDTLHEVKNPLSAIRSSAEVTARELESVESKGQAEELQPFLRSILEESRRIDRLLGELREIGKIDTHLQWDTGDEVKLMACLQEIIQGCHLREDRKILHFSYSCDPGLEGRLAAINEERLRQVLYNIIDNAADFAAESVRLMLTEERGEAGGNNHKARPSGGQSSSSRHKADGKGAARGPRPGHRPIEIRVEDDGPGIAPGDQEQVFRRFFSGRIERKDHSGLGLSICRSIIEAYGGSIRAENRSEGGARFRIILPASASVRHR